MGYGKSMSYKSKPKSKRPTRKRGPSIYFSKKPTKAFTKSVQKVIDRNMEDKQAYKSVVNINYNSGIDSQTDLNSLVPSIAQGTSYSSRIGEQVTAKRLNIKGYILGNLTYTAYSSCRIGVRMMIVSPKSYIGYDAAYNSATTWLGTLLKKGNASSGFTGTVNDFLAPINSDAITKYYDKKFYIRAPLVPGTLTGDVSTSSSTKFFNIKLNLRKKLLKYDSSNNSGLTPTNYTPWLIIGYCHLDSSNPDTVNTQINLNFTSTLDYQDA